MKSSLVNERANTWGQEATETSLSSIPIGYSLLVSVKQGTGMILFLLAISLILVIMGCSTGENILNYNKISFDEKNGVVNYASANSSSSQPFFFRLKTAPDKVYEIATVTTKDAANFGYKRSEARDSYKIGVSGSLSFEEGGWQSIHISGGEIEFAPSRDGEFVSLPVKKSTILRLFGQPISIERPQPSWR